jgi:Lrp/AsnC family leucine-responsive transcriptional regulator
MESEQSSPTASLDSLDVRIVQALGRDGRLSFAELGRRIGLSATAIRQRIRALEDQGVIRGYRADIHPAGVGRPVQAFVRLRPNGGMAAKALRTIKTLPGLLECHAVAGRDCYLLKLAAPSVQALDATVDSLRTTGRTETSIVLSTPVGQRTPDPVELPAE